MSNHPYISPERTMAEVFDSISGDYVRLISLFPRREIDDYVSGDSQIDKSRVGVNTPSAKSR